MPKRKYLLIGAALLACYLALLWYWWVAPPEIPEPEQVVSMQARLYNSPRELPDLPTFEVGPEHFAPILAALRPWKVDRRPAKWQGLGELNLSCRGGKQFLIRLLWTGHETGAFSAGPTHEGRVYCRGGTDAGIEDAIRAAYRSRSQ